MSSLLQRWKHIVLGLINVQSLYVFVVILVSAVGFVRSFLFMKWLNMEELGLISLVQTIILFLSLFQLGLINGGYRLFALDKADEQGKVNNVLFSYFGILSFFLAVIWLFFWFTDTTIIVNNYLLLTSLVAGVFALMNNWLANALIGKRLIKEINIINITASFVSILALALVWAWGITGAVISLIVQPLIFITITLIRHRELRPSAWNFDLKLVRYILSFGFIPFLAGIFAVINMQIERWSIADILGTEALGKFYLVFLYATLFILIPTSLLNIFFPKAIYTYENGQISEFKSILKKHLIILVVYLLTVVVVTIFAMQPFIDFFLPSHSSNTIYVYYFLPGMIFLSLCDPISIILNSTVRLRPLLYVGLITIFVNMVLIYLCNYFGVFTLTNMAIIKTIINFVSFGLYLLYIKLHFKIIFISGND